MIFFALFGVIVNWVAWKKGFYTIPTEKRLSLSFLTFKHVVGLFFIYITTLFFIPPFLRLLPQFKKLPPMISLGYIQAIAMGITIILIYLYSQTLNAQEVKSIWKERHKESKSLLNDLFIGALCWFLTFPLITALGYLIDLLMRYLFKFQSYEQVAVRFLKMAQGDPLLLVIALVTILIFAPFIEEYLFRGILQSYLRRRFGRPGAIALSSLLFALFHLAPSQKLGNVSLVISLFTFACFLGFLYEKKRSLFAPIGLHIAFNLMSSLRVLFMTKGN